MTLHMVTTTITAVGAHKRDENTLQLSVGNSIAHLTVDEVAKLRDYLDGFIGARQQGD